MSRSREPNGMETLRSTFPATSSSEEETRELAEVVAEAVSPGTVLALSGPLGSGKTQFAKGFCAALGVDPARVTSPTFTVVNEYRTEGPPIYHVDAYRLSGEGDVESLELEEYLFGESYCLIEWADRVSGLLPEDALRLAFAHVDRTTRAVRMLEGEEDS